MELMRRTGEDRAMSPVQFAMVKAGGAIEKSLQDYVEVDQQGTDVMINLFVLLFLGVWTPLPMDSGRAESGQWRGGCRAS